MTQTINPEKNYHVVEVNKITLEKRDLGIWSGHGMSKEFKAGFNGFFKEDETFIYYATEIEPETAPETEAKEINQPEPKKATESQPAHHSSIKINFSLSALRAQREKLARQSWHEYQTRGNTQRCQELWSQITKLDEEIARRTSK